MFDDCSPKQAYNPRHDPHRTELPQEAAPGTVRRHRHRFRRWRAQRRRAPGQACRQARSGARAPLHAGGLHARLSPSRLRVGRGRALHRRSRRPAVGDEAALRSRDRRQPRVGADGRGLRPDRSGQEHIRLRRRARGVRSPDEGVLSGREGLDRPLSGAHQESQEVEWALLRRESGTVPDRSRCRRPDALTVPALRTANDEVGAGPAHRQRRAQGRCSPASSATTGCLQGDRASPCMPS